MTYYKQIDSFRFFAAFAVLTTHWLHSLPATKILELGFIGVDFFFVVSGFLISYQLFELSKSVSEKKISLIKAIRNFVIRRGLRIFPLYYLILILATSFNEGEIRDAFLYNVSYTSNFYFIKIQYWTSTFSHFWSLSVEEHFYLVWPMVLLIAKRKFIPFLILVITITSIAFRYFSFTNTPDFFTVHIHTLSCLDLFMFGAILAYFLFRFKDEFLQFFSRKIVKNAIVAGLLLSYAALLVFHDVEVFKWVFFRSLFGIFSAGLIGLLVIGFKGTAKTIFENKWLILGGKLSYAIYLLHNFVPGILLEIKKLDLPIGVEFIIYFIFTVLLSYLLNKAVEKPIRRLGQKFQIK